MQATVTGELRVAPATVTDTTIPSGTSLLDYTFAKDYAVQTGLMVRQLLDPTSFVTLDGTGATSAVTRGELLVLRATAPTVLRMTQNGLSAQTINIPGNGAAVVIPFDPAFQLTLLEAKGNGKLEYFVAGPQ